MEHRPDELSGGQSSASRYSPALASDPEVLLADEPTGDLDAHSAQEIMDLLAALNRDHGKTNHCRSRTIRASRAAPGGSCISTKACCRPITLQAIRRTRAPTWETGRRGDGGKLPSSPACG